MAYANKYEDTSLQNYWNVVGEYIGGVQAIFSVFYAFFWFSPVTYLWELFTFLPKLVSGAIITAGPIIWLSAPQEWLPVPPAEYFEPDYEVPK